MTEWQDISTAPDGELILVWADRLHRGLPSAEVVMIFRDGDGSIESYWTNGGPNAGSDLEFESAPTHWMPLPEPPDHKD